MGGAFPEGEHDAVKLKKIHKERTERG